MKYALISTAGVILCFAVSWLVSKRIVSVRKRPLWVRAVFILVLALLLQGAAAAVYFSVYYRAKAGVDASLADGDGVEVRSLERMVFFDGPGTESAMVFYPGAKVEAKAYAPLLKRIASEGIDCVLLEPPFRFPLLDINGIRRAYGIGTYASWYIAGHSLGGTAAASYASSHPEEIAGVILLGAYPGASLMDTRLLMIYGSEDHVLSKTEYENSRMRWPKDAEEHVILGGNHAGFGCYGPQKGDGTASISQEEQQKETADYIHSFVTSNS